MIEKHQPYFCVNNWDLEFPCFLIFTNRSYHSRPLRPWGDTNSLTTSQLVDRLVAGGGLEFQLTSFDDQPQKTNIHKNLYVITIFVCPDFFLYKFYFSVTFKKHVLSFECMVFLCVFQSFIAFPPCRSGLQSCLTDQMQSALVKVKQAWGSFTSRY